MANQDNVGADGASDPFLSNLINKYLQDNTPIINAETDPDKRAALEQKLQDRVQKIASTYAVYGQAAFTPKPKPSELDVPWAIDNPMGQTPNSPIYQGDYGYNGPPRADASQGDVFSEGGAQASESQFADSPGYELEKAKDLTKSLAKNYTPAGLIAPVAGGLAAVPYLAMGQGDKAANLIRDTEDLLTPKLKTEEGENYDDVIGAPWTALGKATRRAGEAIQDSPALASAYGLASPLGPPGALLGMSETGRNLLATMEETGTQGSLFLLGKHGEEAPKPKIKDPDIKAGVDAGMKAAPDSVKPEEYKQQPDLFSSQPELGLDMFSKESVPADLIESRRQQAELANKKEAPQRSEAEDAKLEQDYLFDQQDRLNRGSQQEDLVSRQGDIPSAYLDIPHTELPEGDVNTLMYRQMMQALANRGQLRNPSIPVKAPEPTAGQTFQPSRVPTIEQDATQGNLELPATQDLFGAKQEQGPASAVDATQAPPTTAAPTAAKAKTVAELRSSAQAKLDALKNKSNPVPAFGDDPSVHNRLPAFILDAHDKGELTAGHVIDAAADNHEGLFDNDPAQQGLAEELRKNGEALGGLDSKVEVIPEDPSEHSPAHQDFVQRYNDFAKAEGKPAWDQVKGAYDPQTKTTYINGPKNMDLGTLLHESTHAVTHAAIQAGIDGKLTGTRLQAFNAMQNLFEATKNVAGKDAGRYGFTDLHEFAAELRSNPTFRTALKNIPLDSVAAGKMGFGRLLVGKVKNMYEAAIKGLSKMIGLSPKAETAYDAAVSTSESFLKSFDKAPEEAGQPAARENEKYKAPVTNPLSRTQRLVRDAGTTVRHLFTSVRTTPERDIARAGADASGAVTNARRQAEQIARHLETTRKAEGADKSEVEAYMHGNPEADLSEYPKTKEVIDKHFIPARDSNRLAVAEGIINNPNAGEADLKFAHAVLDNPDYLMRGYNDEDFSENLIKNADKAEQLINQGKPLTAEQQEAKHTVDRAVEKIKSDYLPTADFGNKPVTLGHLRTMADGIGIKATQLLKGIKGTSAKKQILIKAIKEAVPDEQSINKMARQLLFEVAGLINKGGSKVAAYSRGARYTDIMTSRKAVPPEFRALWGEVHDPASLIVNTLVKQQRGIAQLKQQAQLRSAGIDHGYIFTSKVDAPAGFTEKLSGKKFGYLQDTYTSPEVKQLLSAHVELNTAANSWFAAINSRNPTNAVAQWLWNKAGNGWVRLRGGYKLGTLATDPVYPMMYLTGGPSILLMHGITDPTLVGRGIAASWAMRFPKLLDHLSADHRAQVEADVSTAVKSGLQEPSMAGEMLDWQQNRLMAEALNAGRYENPMKTLARLPLRALDKVESAAMNGLSMLDSYARIAAMLHRNEFMQKFYERTGKTVDPEQVRSEAADWIHDTVITTARAPLAGRLIENWGFGRGVNYGLETIRNSVNAGIHAIKDFRTGMEAGDTRMMIQASKQFTGNAVAMKYMSSAIAALGGTLLATAGVATKVLSPTNPDEEDFLQREGSRLRGERPNELLDQNNPDENNRYLYSPGSKLDYLYATSNPLNVLEDAYHQYMAGEKVDGGDVAKKAAETFLGSFWNDALAKRLMNIAKAKQPGWMSQTPDYTDQRAKFYGDMNLSEDNINRMLALEDIFTTGLGRNAKIADELPTKSTPIKLLTELGLGVTKISKTADLEGRTAGQLAKDEKEAKSNLDRTLKSTADFSPEAVDNAYKDAFIKSYKVLKTADAAIRFAKSSGRDEDQAAAAMNTGGVNKEIMAQSISGNMNPAMMLYKNLTSDIVKEIRQNLAEHPDRAEHLTEVYTNRMEQLANLTEKYSAMTPQEIEGLK